MLIHNAVITGSLTLNGTDIGDITGSEAAINALNIFSSSIYAYTASNDTTNTTQNNRLSSLEITSGSLLTASGSFSTRVTTLETASGSFSTRVTNTETTASNLTVASSSFSTRVTNNETTGSNLVAASASFSTRVANTEATASSLTTASGSFSTRTTNLETASGSFSTRVTTNETNISNLQTASGSFSTRVTSAESSIVSLQDATGSYATTGSNNFVNTQRISATNNAIGFTSTASLYTDGGLRVAKDAYVSGTLYLNNLTVYGTQSVQYITASQLNISTNIISVNTDTPSIRYGGLSVYDSGSTGLTGSLLWDSEANHWIYTNPSGSTYSGGMLISGPRASALGSEQGTTACALMMGQGGDHITSSGIFHYGNATCFYGNTVVGSGGTVCTTMANASCVGIGTMTPTGRLTINVGTNQNVRVSCETHTAIQAVNDAANAYVPFKVDGSCLLLNTQSGGNIGIGTSSPGRTVHILGQTGIGTVLKLEGAAGTTTYLQLSYNGATNVQSGYIGYDSSANMALFTNDTERMRITSTGIACFACQVCSPSFVGGTVSGTTGTFSGKICANTAGTVTSGFADGLNLGSWDAVGYTSAGTDLVLGGYRASQWSGVQIHTSGASRLAVSSTGIACFSNTVCVGGVLVVNGNTINVNCDTTTATDARINLYTRNSVNGDRASIYTYNLSATTGGCELTYLAFGYCCTNNQGYINMQTKSGGAWCNTMYLINGRVGIGTDAPNYKLEVNGTSCFAGNVAIGGTYCAFALNVHGVTYQIGGSVWVQNGYGYVNAGAVSTGLFPLSDCSIQLRIANSAALTVDPTQNVGLGTTTPKTRVFSLGLAGGQLGAGGCGCSAYSGGGKAALTSYFGDQFGNGAPYGTSAGAIAPYPVWYGGGAGGYFKGGDGSPGPGGGGAGIVAIGGDGSSYISGGSPYAEGGAGIYARGGFNVVDCVKTWAGYFDGSLYACGNVGIGSTSPLGSLQITTKPSTARNTLIMGQAPGASIDYTGFIGYNAYIDSSGVLTHASSNGRGAFIIEHIASLAGSSSATIRLLSPTLTNEGCLTISGNNFCFSGQVCVSTQLVVQGGGNSIYAWSNCLTTQPGLRALHCNGGDINGVYAKVYAPDIAATVFGQDIGCKAILASEGACNNGLLLGSLNNAPVYIGSNNQNRILLAASGIACFACQVCAPILTTQADNFSPNTNATTLLTTLPAANAMYIISVQPEAGAGGSLFAFITSRTNSDPAVTYIVCNGSCFSFQNSGFNICVKWCQSYAISARWGILRMA